MVINPFCLSWSTRSAGFAMPGRLLIALPRDTGVGGSEEVTLSPIPANIPTYGYSENIEQVDEVRLTLRSEGVKSVLGDEFDPTFLQEPRLTFNDDGLQALGRLLFGCDAADRSKALVC